MKKLVILVVGVLVLVAACASNKEAAKKEESNNQNYCELDCEKADMSGYDGLKDENHVFGSITFEQANRYLQAENFTGILYFGFDTCPWCREAVPVMNDVAKELGLSIYYVDKKSAENEAHPEWITETTKLLDAAYGLRKNDQGEPTLYVPEVVVVKDGKVISHHMGTLDDHDATKRKMTNSEVKELTSIYEKMFKEIK